MTTTFKHGRGALLATCCLVLAMSAALAPIPAAAQSYVRIKNLANGMYLYEDNSGVVRYAASVPADRTSHWLVEDYAGSKRIRNRVTGHYMAIEHQLGYVESIPIYDVWMSPRWTLEAAPTAGYTIIRNVWLPANIVYANAQQPRADYGNVATSSPSAQWLLEPAPPAYVRIRNVWTGGYLYDDTAERSSCAPIRPQDPDPVPAGSGCYQVKIGVTGMPVATDTTSHWLIEDYAGSKRIRNRATGNYVSIEHLTTYVESLPVLDGWMSPRWTFEPASSPAGAIYIRSAYQPDKRIHVENQRGYAEYGAAPDVWSSAKWVLEDAPPINYVRIKNLWNGTYLFDSSGQVRYAASAATDTRSHWLVEDYAGSKRLRNRATGNYMSILHGQLWVEGIANDDTTSARWSLEAAPVPGYTTIRSVAQNTKIVHIASLQGYAEYGTVPTSHSGAVWLFEDANAAASYVRIKSLLNNTYLYESGNLVKYGNPAAFDTTSHWQIEDYAGSKRIRNRATGNYMAIQNQLMVVESIPVSNTWMSPRWTFENTTPSGYIRIRSAWLTSNVIHIENQQQPYAQYGNVSSTSSKWLLEEAPRGATLPWVEYEAEAGATTGTILGPNTIRGDFPNESSGRSAVRLDATNQYVRITASQAANSIVARYSIPDVPQGAATATLSLYVNNVFRQKLNMTSKYSWGDAPEFGGLHHFFDETHALLASGIPAGATVMLRKDSTDTASYYIIDLIDLEQVGPALTMPANFLSITSPTCGATPDTVNATDDDGEKIRSCIATAKMQGLGVWIPPGAFDSTTAPIVVSDVTIRGAGMWYSTIRGPRASFHCAGNNCRFYDFAVFGESVARVVETKEFGFFGKAGTGSRLENIWVEHTQVGYWIGNNDKSFPITDGLVITGGRFRDLWADGTTLCNGAKNVVIYNNHYRNTGDDAIASWAWADGGDPTSSNNTFQFNTVQVPWRANCFALYGGTDNRIEDNLCFDVPTYPGISIASEFTSYPFSGLTSVQRNTLVRAGGLMWAQGVQYGALSVRASDNPIRGLPHGLLVHDVDVIDPTYSALEIEGIPSWSYGTSDATFSNVILADAGTWGVEIAPTARGDGTFSGVVVSNPTSGGLTVGAGSTFTIVRGAGNSGW